MDENPPTRNHGQQPLHQILLDLGLENHDLVAASPSPLTHKAVQRARQGRQLTPHMQRRICQALNLAAGQRQLPTTTWTVRDLFTYPVQPPQRNA